MRILQAQLQIIQMSGCLLRCDCSTEVIFLLVSKVTLVEEIADLMHVAPEQLIVPFQPLHKPLRCYDASLPLL